MRAGVWMTLLLMASMVTFPCATAYPLQANDSVIANALYYLHSQQKSSGKIGGYALSEWAVMAITAAGENASSANWTVGGNSLADYILANQHLVDTDLATDVERHILTLLCLGVDPRNSSGIDYVQKLGDLYKQGQIGDPSLLNDDFWGVIALVAAGVDPSNSTIIKDSVQFIKDNQNADGGWSMNVGGPSDTDDTAIAVLALLMAGESTTSDEVKRGMQFIRDSQDASGGFVSDPSFGTSPTSEATSWAIWAILAMGESPTSGEWTKNDNPVDFLKSMQDSDGAFFHLPNTRSSPVMSTSYAIIALMGKRIPVVSSSTPTPEPSYTLVFPETTIWADRASVYAGEQFTVFVYYYDAGRWRPLPGAEVSAGGQVLVTDTSGTLSMNITTPGTYTLRASKRYYNSSEFRIEVLSPPTEVQQEVERMLEKHSKPSMLYMNESPTGGEGHLENGAVEDEAAWREPEPAARGGGAVLSLGALLAALLLFGRWRR
ncbi:prenyltransferase/squalene oxidase repeat-containing protein [Methermicoccus shengliensis]|uniref:Squalene cyclase C-terminal domain-containing protein n=1 Tax=Methermicoccus shengliensis TaxID=660064 RepID=A0A832RY47_9EURY|nr:prenyltransferase/squalene oxidase repeat-containing protein [Methermicoccus shengliensis]MDI3488621.1 hypothetical protein [Methanosarcinales archaeon]HIH69516.1 hypothetical protein [Methermicoccus shengliensis]